MQDEGWRPSITVTQVLKGIQELLDDPNETSPAQADAYVIFVNKKNEYYERCKKQAVKYQMS